METELKRDIGKYRLLYFQPNPEDGERVCVGLLFQDRRSLSVLYDGRFPKVRCIAPSYEPELVKFYLDDLDATLRRRSEDDLGLILRRYGPQLVASEERIVSLPLSESKKLSLLERFVARGGRPKVELAPAQAKGTSADQVGEHIRKFVEEYVQPTGVKVFRDALSQDLLGYRVPALGRVAMAVKKPRKMILIDGVDLRLLPKKQAIDRANRVAYTFWQYGRIQGDSIVLAKTPISRIGVVLNGSTKKGRGYYEAHDFALHQFQKEADIAVDTMSGEGTQEMAAALGSIE